MSAAKKFPIESFYHVTTPVFAVNLRLGEKKKRAATPTCYVVDVDNLLPSQQSVFLQ
jgi:hypothetical protein